jgi:hypothetical protein
MIQIIPFNKSLFNDFHIEESKLTKYCYIVELNLICELMKIDLPIKNRKIALRNILDFLFYIEGIVEKSNSTIIPIASRKFDEFFSRNKYKDYLKILKSLDIMTDVPYEDGTFYKRKNLFKQYRIHSDYFNKEDLAIVVLEDDDKDYKFINTVDGLDERYINTIKHLEIDIHKAIEAEIQYFNEKSLSIQTLKKRISKIFYTKRKRFIKKGKKVERIYHSFTNVSRVSRKHLNVHLYSIDIVNCQPLILVANLRDKGMKFDRQYQNDCEEGIFYEGFMDINKPDNVSFEDEDWRGDTKKAIYKNIFFGFNKRSKHNKRFKELYPDTWYSLSLIYESPVSLASQLQNIESSLFNKITPKFSKYYFTLFDAIYFDNITDKYPLENIIKRYFLEYGIKAKVK